MELMPSLSASGAYTSMVSRALKRLLSGGSAASVRMLCSLSASLMMTTRMSFDMARNILRSVRACFSSMELTLMEVSFVTPSTSSATVSPKRSRTSSRVTGVSSTVSCSSAAQMGSASMRRSFARMNATSTGWLMYASPERRRWSRWHSAAKLYASSTFARPSASRYSAQVLRRMRQLSAWGTFLRRLGSPAATEVSPMKTPLVGYD